MRLMLKWILSFSLVTTLTGIIAFTKIAGPAAGFAKVVFVLIALLFVISIIQVVIQKARK